MTIQGYDIIALVTGGALEHYSGMPVESINAPVIAVEGGFHSLVVTVSGDVGAQHAVLVRRSTALAWTPGGVRTGDGTVTVSDLAAGVYYVIAYSVAGGALSTPSNMMTATVIDTVGPSGPGQPGTQVLPAKVKVAYLGKEEVFVRSTETGDYVNPDASFYLTGGSMFPSEDYVWTLTEPTAVPRSWILQGKTATNPFGVYSPVEGSGATGNAIVGVIPKFSGQVKAPGRSFQKRLRAKGVFAGIRIGNSAKGQTWGIERVTGQAVDGGPVR